VKLGVQWELDVGRGYPSPQGSRSGGGVVVQLSLPIEIDFYPKMASCGSF